MNQSVLILCISWLQDSVILHLGTGHRSWWLEHGLGCQVTTNLDNQSSTPQQSPSESDVHGCFLDYYYVEVIHAGVQCLLAVSMVMEVSPTMIDTSMMPYLKIFHVHEQ